MSTLPGAPELLERDDELSAVYRLIGSVGEGGRLLAIEGPPGIGKSTLVATAKSVGQTAGRRVLAARGTELDHPFVYGVVRQLFEPLLASTRGDERAGLFAGAAGLCASVFDPGQIASEHEGDSSLATLHGLYWLTANLAEREPLLLAIDDLQWCDLASLRWLGYLLPRLEGLEVAVLVALRAEPPSHGGTSLLTRVLSDPAVTVLRPDALTVEATARLLADATASDINDAFAAACQQATGGNPLLVRELVRCIVADGLEPLASNVPRVQEVAALAGWRAVAARFAGLPSGAKQLAEAVAVLGDDVDPQIAGALAGLAPDEVSDAGAALARVDLLRPSTPYGFVHPLAAAAVYEQMPASDRARAHDTAARLLLAGGADPERVAAHLLRSPTGGDSVVVTTLRAAARRAASRGGAESAVAYLRRALDEPPAEDERLDVLAELGAAEAHVDGEAAIGHLRDAHDLTDDPIRGARIALVLGRQLFFLRDEEAENMYTNALEKLAGADAELEHLLEAGLLHAELFVPGRHEAARLRLDRIRDRAANRTTGEKLLLSLLAFYDAVSGAEPADVVVSLARRALAGGDLVRADVSAAVVPLCIVLGMADLDEALVVFGDVLAEAHRQGSTLTYAAVKAFRAQTLVWRGDLAEAEAESRDALAITESWGSTARFAGHAAAFLADSLMEQGKLDDAAAALASTESLPESARMLYVRDSDARLRILRGDLAGGATDRVEACHQYDSVDIRNPALIAWRSPAALALLQLGENEEAARLATEELEFARVWGAPRTLSAALRVVGLVAGGERGLAHLEEAVELSANSPAKLEHAKARTELGAALRRAGRRVQAREHLRHALELASGCGAVPLTERAESELRATGARPRRVALSGVASLTPSERRVAELAARGSTNRAIAQELFVTQRTIEVHLTSVFRKLAISSRAQLSEALRDQTAT